MGVLRTLRPPLPDGPASDRLLGRPAAGPDARGHAARDPLRPAAAALVEAGWYAIATGLPADRILEANLSLIAGVRPAQWVALGGLAIAAAMAVRLLIGPMNKLPMTMLAARVPASTIILPARETRR